MDRRQRKTREAIFYAFTELLSHKKYSQITVGEIIDKADIGRATFYAHFETKDFLLKAFCEELFCHIFDVSYAEENEHRHIFACSGSDDVFLHLYQHFQKNDNQILTLLASENNDLFLRYFRDNLDQLIESQFAMFASRRDARLPNAFWKNHIAAVFVETLQWWIGTGMKESPETITEYFFLAV